MKELLEQWEYIGEDPKLKQFLYEINHTLFNENNIEKKLVIFDEATSGLDYKHMIQTGEIIQKLSHEGYIVLVITHDYEFLNLVCHSVIQLGEQSAVKGGMQSEEAREEKETKLV